MQHHKYSLTELENMLPWEREIYMGVLIQHIKDEKDRARERASKGKKWIKLKYKKLLESMK